MARRPVRGVTSRQRYAALSRSQRDTYERVRLAAMDFREAGVPLSRAARRHGTTVGTVKRYLGLEFEKAGGRYQPRGDRAGAPMQILSTEGPDVVFVTGSRRRSLLGEHWSAVQHYLNTGDESRLERLQGKRVAGITLETDPDAVEEWARRGELEIDDIYDLTT